METTTIVDHEPSDLSAIIDMLGEARAEVARQKGRRDALLERQAELIDQVGEAKARVGMKGDIEKFISDLQQEAFAQATHSLETLLTSIVQEVLPTSSPVGLELGTERGLPALDISVVGPGGTREDIYEDHGGSLSNVVVMGLRLIAAVKSGGAKFLALDEPECWVMPERVPAFFDVLRDASLRLGVQTIAITHHSASANFDRSVRVSSIAGHPDTGVVIESDFPPYDWDNGEDGFHWIRLINFQAFADARWDLTPGLNALIGGNDLGKSCIIRAMRAVFYGEARDKQIRHFTDGFTIQLGIKGKRYLQLSRELKRNPKNIWSLHHHDGSVVVDDGKRHETGGRDVPDWVDRMWGISKKDDNETHIAHQKRPVYLIDKPNTQKASVLSIGQESAYTTDMLKIAKERISTDNSTIKSGEIEVGNIRAALDRMTSLDGADDDLKLAEQDLEICLRTRKEITDLQEQIQGIRAIEAALRAARVRQAAYADIPTPGQLETFMQRLARTEAMAVAVTDLRSTSVALQTTRARRQALSLLPETSPILEQTEGLSRAIGSIRDASNAISACQSRRLAYQDLPAEFPILTDTSDLEAAIATIRNINMELEATRERRRNIAAALIATRATIDNLLTAGGGSCPTCGHAVTADELLHHHGQELAR